MIISDFYDERCRIAEHSWQASCWGSEQDQYGRFAVAASYISNNSSVLDVGCGQGDLYRFGKNRGLGWSYTGIDISPLMVEASKCRFRMAEFLCGDFLNSQIDRHDHVVALGTFSLKQDDPYNYLRLSLQRCYNLCESSAFATILIKGAEFVDDKPESKLFYYEPERIFEIARSITPHITIDTASLNCEAALCMKRRKK
jgi:SAM-dependent methyltransferase